MAVTPVVTPSPNVGTHGYVTIVDAQGYVIGTVAVSDGAQFGSISGQSPFLFNNGGPVDANGLPTQNSFDRARGYLGKSSVTKTITSTLVGDTSLTFSAAPKTIMPGHALRLSGGAVDEYVYVDPSYVPSSSATVIPLADPVVNAGQTSAIYDQFDPKGPANASFNPVGVGLTVLAMASNVGSSLFAVQSAQADAVSPNVLLETVIGGISGSNTVERLRTPKVFKALNAQAVTAQAANTPTSIWTPASSKKFRLMGYSFSSSAAAGIVFHDLATQGSGGLLSMPSPLLPAGGVYTTPPLGNGILSAASNNQLWIDATVATTLTGFCWGCEE